jgi:very-short-patch-repair endonuclease
VIDHNEEAKHLMARCDNELEQLWFIRFIAFRPQGLLVDPQKPIGPYRVDFAIDNRLVVEIDGYLYHRQSRDQLVYEYRRDRELTMLGWTVIHFGGIELWEDPEGCARQALDYLAMWPARAVEDKLPPDSAPGSLASCAWGREQRSNGPMFRPGGELVPPESA